MKTCSVPECDSAHYGLGFCRKHYMRVRTHGNPSVDGRVKRTDLSVRFWEKVSKSSGCWEWTGCKGKKGYGEIGIGGKRGTAFAHRVSYELHHGAIPDGMHILHKCDNPSCVRPDHLFAGTHTDNMRDMWAKERGRCDGAGRVGSANGNHRLTEAQVTDILEQLGDGKSRRSIGNQYGVSKTLIGLIAKGKVWKHVNRGTQQ